MRIRREAAAIVANSDVFVHRSANGFHGRGSGPM